MKIVLKAVGCLVFVGLLQACLPSAGSELPVTNLIDNPPGAAKLVGISSKPHGTSVVTRTEELHPENMDGFFRFWVVADCDTAKEVSVVSTKQFPVERVEQDWLKFENKLDLDQTQAYFQKMGIASKLSGFSKGSKLLCGKHFPESRGAKL